MLYLLIIFVVIQIICWFVSERNKKQLTPEELSLLKKASFHDNYDITFAFGLIVFVVFFATDYIEWLTPYPKLFVLTICFAWTIVLRIGVNQAKLPKRFIRIDNIVFAIQAVLLIPFFYFLFYFDSSK